MNAPNPTRAMTERNLQAETFRLLQAMDTRMVRVETRLVNIMRHFDIDVPGGGPRKAPTQLGRIT